MSCLHCYISLTAVYFNKKLIDIYVAEQLKPMGSVSMAMSHLKPIAGHGKRRGDSNQLNHHRCSLYLFQSEQNTKGMSDGTIIKDPLHVGTEHCDIGFSKGRFYLSVII